MTKAEQFLTLVKECQRGRPRKPHSEMFANFQVAEHVEKKTVVVELPQKCGLVLKQGEICTGPLDASNRGKFGCESCEHFARKW